MIRRAVVLLLTSHSSLMMICYSICDLTLILRFRCTFGYQTEKVVVIMPDDNDDRLNEIDGRLRSVEQAVCELATMAKYMRFLVLIVGASLGVDVSGAI